jgi:hydrogenase maturation protease
MTSGDTGVSVVVLGVGNLLLGDDGLGPATVDALRQEAGLPSGTVLVDGGTRGLALLPQIAAADALVLVDAVDLGPGHPPGTLHVVAGDGIGDVYRPRATAHQVGVSDLIAVARFARALPERVVLVGLQPADTSTRVGLSQHVAAALPTALTEVRVQCRLLLEEVSTPAPQRSHARPSSAAHRGVT